MSDRAVLIIQYFNYLVDEYGFSIAQKEFDSQMMGNAVVVFESSKYGIEVVVDRNQVLIRIGEQSAPRMQWFEFYSVIMYYASDIKNVYIFPEKTVDNTWNEIVETQLRRLSILLRKYCEPLLKGKGWRKKQIKEIEKKRASEIFKKLHIKTLN